MTRIRPLMVHLPAGIFALSLAWTAHASPGGGTGAAPDPNLAALVMSPVVVRHLLLVAVPLAILVTVFLLWARRLRKTVLQRTAELRQSEVQYRQIAQHLGDIVWLGDLDSGRILFVNQAFERVCGRDIRSLYARPRWFFKIVHPEDRRQVGLAAKLLAAGDIETFDLEHRIVRPDGEIRWLHSRSYPIRNSRGTVIRHAGVATDITERRAADSALLAGEERAQRQRSALVRLLVDEAVAVGRLPEAFWRVAEILAQGIGVARASVWTFSDDGAELVCQALVTKEGRTPPGPPLTSADIPHYFDAVRTEGRIYVEHAHTDPRTSELTAHYFRPLGIASLLDAAIQVGGSLKGVVSVEHVGEPRRWHPDEEAFVTTLAALAAQVLTAAERALAEERLRESEQRFRTLADHIPGVVYLCRNDARFTMVYLNRAVEQLTGYRREEFLTDRMSFVDLYHPHDVAQIFAAVNEAVAKREPYHLLYRLQHRDGAWRWAEEWGVGLYVGDELTFLEGFVGDVTERKLAEDRLRDSETRARTFFEADPDALFVIGPDGRYVEANPVATERYGYSRGEFLTLSPFDLAAPDLRDQVPARMDEIRRAEQRFDWRHRTRDGREIPVAIITRPITLDGWPCVLAKVRDISERMELEEQLRHSQKMEAIGTLAGGVAHDFNNLLQAMMTQLQLVADQGGDPAALAGVVAALQQQVRHGASLTRQLLLFSRRETATLEPFDLNRIVEASTAMLRRLIGENVSLIVEGAVEPLLVECDRGQIEQVLVNLVLNASQAMPRGGTVTVRTGPAGLKMVAVEVADTGAGIPPEHRERIFDPFFTTKSAEQGTGLGLAVVHGIVSRHGGTIELDSALGRGSTFRVLLPRRDGRRAGSADLNGLGNDLERGNGEHVLVVEDEDAAREGLREILTALGYRVTACGSAEEARDVAGTPFDLLLTDLVLPGVHGLELARTLVRRHPDLRVILMSGYSQEDVVRRGAAEGTLHFLQKPFDMATLARELRAALTAS